MLLYCSEHCSKYNLFDFIKGKTSSVTFNTGKIESHFRKECWDIGKYETDRKFRFIISKGTIMPSGIKIWIGTLVLESQLFIHHLCKTFWSLNPTLKGELNTWLQICNIIIKVRFSLSECSHQFPARHVLFKVSLILNIRKEKLMYF